MSSSELWSKDVNQLKEELRSKGLDINGSKPVLIKRIQMYEESYKKRLEG